MKQESEQFKIEATPVIDLKKASVKDVWDNEKTEVYLEDEGDGSSAYLLTAEGDYIPISAFPFVIGRGNECDLVLNGKGISRKHVEIVFQSGRFVVNDLDSLNGLKVNGYKVARVILEEGDSIKLGEIALVFTSSKSGKVHQDGAEAPVADSHIKATAKKNNRKLLYTLGSLAIVTLIGVAAVTIWGKSGQMSSLQSQRIVVAANPVGSIERNEKVSDKVVEDIVVATASTASDATVESTNVPSVDSSINSVAPPPSIAPLMPDLPDRNVPQSVERKVVVQPTKAVERVAAPKVVTTPSKQSVQRAVVTPGTSTSPKVAAMNGTSAFEDRYRSGDADRALHDMKQAISDGRVSDPAIKARYSSIIAMYNKYLAGKQAFVEGRKAEGIANWSDFLKQEKAAFGAKRSVMAASAATKLTDELVLLGNVAAREGKHHEAYKYWKNSLSFGDSVAARIAIDSVNQKSKQLYRQALRLEYVNTERAKELWRQVIEIVPPGSEYHTKATSKLAWYEKWGA